MADTGKPTRPPRPVPYVMDEDQARLLARLTEDYAGAVHDIQGLTPHLSLAALMYAVQAHQAERIWASDPRWRKSAGITEVPADRGDDVAAALTLLQVARTSSSRTGKPLLTFKKIAAALGVESEQAAQGRYRRKVGNLNGSIYGADGTPWPGAIRFLPRIHPAWLRACR